MSYSPEAKFRKEENTVGPLANETLTDLLQECVGESNSLYELIDLLDKKLCLQEMSCDAAIDCYIPDNIYDLSVLLVGRLRYLSSRLHKISSQI